MELFSKNVIANYNIVIWISNSFPNSSLIIFRSKLFVKGLLFLWVFFQLIQLWSRAVIFLPTARLQNSWFRFYMSVMFELLICKLACSIVWEKQITTSCLNSLNTCTIKITVDPQGCVPWKSSCTRCYKENHGKLYIIVKIIFCRIRD